MPTEVLPFQVPPVVKTVTLPCAPARAFDLFTADIGRWWPLGTHHIAPEPVTCLIEVRPGGRVFERSAAGVGSLWGTVLEWSPPGRLAFTWRVNLAPENEQRIDVTFAPAAECTRVELVHSGWEKLGDTVAAASRRDSYDRGWGVVFERAFADHARAAA
jgi:uncharacterized protein YndB with AHSA1/START domain